MSCDKQKKLVENMLPFTPKNMNNKDLLITCMLQL